MDALHSYNLDGNVKLWQTQVLVTQALKPSLKTEMLPARDLPSERHISLVIVCFGGNSGLTSVFGANQHVNERLFIKLAACHSSITGRIGISDNCRWWWQFSRSSFSNAEGQEVLLISVICSHQQFFYTNKISTNHFSRLLKRCRFFYGVYLSIFRWCWNAEVFRNI